MTRILNQFEELGNYRFHFHCTAAAAEEVVGALGLEASAFVFSALSMAAAGLYQVVDQLRALLR